MAQHTSNYEVIYDWQAENDDDLSLRSGEIVMVQDQHEHGWWYGFIQRDGSLLKGHFPKNYVKPLANAPPAPPPPPMRPLSIRKDEDDINDVTTLSKRISRMLIDTPVVVGKGFALGSLEAYDDLAQYGIAVEIVKAVDDSIPAVEIDMRVELDIVGMIWDGSETITKEFGRGKLTFTTGNEQVTKGLDTAIQKLKVGECATVTCCPTTAYGAAGNPPFISPFTYVIYKVQVLSAVKDDLAPVPPPVGPEAMIGTGLAPRGYNKTKSQVEKSVVLDE